MHHQAVKSNLIDSSLTIDKLGYDQDQPLCPKPRRLSHAIPEILKPLKCPKHSQPTSDERMGVLNMITEKNRDVKEPICNGCLPSCYSGSPPRRTENPLVHDVEFLHQMELVSPFARSKLSDKFGFAAASASPI
ncbi:hypothetical protein L6164_020204 [Bauhinia variegata]|uniref:Uncharacterized protein n=1 Tax=Bauhinia variegata TaxID=167791 RepID=A0ACB9MXQ9_BAUVA|nr:hypothetical protein L6164_020204 [Bauhinia variegata]